MSEIVVQKIKERFPDSFLDSYSFRDENTVIIKKEDLVAVCRYLKSDPELSFDFLSDLCGVDYMGRETRFEVVYHLFSISKRHRIRLKAMVGEGEKISSVTGIWSTSDWHEREAFDMYGIIFEGHPNLTRILMPENWDGHPLRKDYPLKGR
ncbi:MAG: NADH-quinone oxidoreductase subunit C [Deltaproteobacteria bacterium]|nr:NADH-quinone oxidoreductase subunit C [Deltaproteobacteria bacterium]